MVLFYTFVLKCVRDSSGILLCWLKFTKPTIKDIANSPTEPEALLFFNRNCTGEVTPK